LSLPGVSPLELRGGTCKLTGPGSVPVPAEHRPGRRPGLVAGCDPAGRPVARVGVRASTAAIQVTSSQAAGRRAAVVSV